jgi:hypothetical protein
MSLLRRALGRTLYAAVNQQGRAIGSSAGPGQAAAAAQPQPVAVEEQQQASTSQSSSSSSPHLLPRWRRELGVVRNDWT